MERKKERKEKTVDLSIKRVPEHLVARLRRRAAAHHRSLQGELLSVLEEAVYPRQATVKEVREQILKLGIHTGDESTRMIREDRDVR